MGRKPRSKKKKRKEKTQLLQEIKSKEEAKGGRVNKNNNQQRKRTRLGQNESGDARRSGSPFQMSSPCQRDRLDFQ